MDILASALPSLFDYHRPDSFVNRLRRRRAEGLTRLLESVPREQTVRILDVGGTLHYWRTTGMLDPDRYEITLLNLEEEQLPADTRGFESLAGDATSLPFPDASFDVVFSNSVIEHMGSRERQRQMADEVRRVGRRFIIQTPSKWFPLEPHSHIPLFQFLPRPARALLIQHFTINYFPTRPTFKECMEVSDSTILLARGEFQRLFPEASIMVERLAGLTKSYTAVGGWR